MQHRESAVPKYVMGLDPGPKWSAGAVVKYVGNLMDYDEAKNYQIIDFWEWKLRDDNKYLDDSVHVLGKYLNDNPFAQSAKVEKIVESQEGGDFRGVAFHAIRNHTIGGVMMGYFLSLNHRVHYAAKRSKWPWFNDKEPRVEHVRKILQQQHRANSLVLPKFNHLREQYQNAPYKVFEDVADAILIATCRMRSNIIDYLREQGRIGGKGKRPFKDTKSTLKQTDMQGYINGAKAKVKPKVIDLTKGKTKRKTKTASTTTTSRKRKPSIASPPTKRRKLTVTSINIS